MMPGRLGSLIFPVSLILPLLGLAQQPSPADAEQVRSAFTRSMDEGRLLGNGGAVELLAKLKPLVSEDAWSDARGKLVNELLRRGDQVVSTYMFGDEIPPSPAQYDQCDQWFRAANELERSEYAELRMWFCHGRSLMASGGLYAAIEALKRAVSVARNAASPAAQRAPFAYNALGVAYLKFGRISEAEEQFNIAADQEPGWTYPWHHLALAALARGDYPEAQKRYSKAIAAAEKNQQSLGYLHYNLGVLAHEVGDRKEAEKEYRRAQELFEEQRQANQARAKQLESSGNAAEAQPVLERANGFARDEAEAWNALGALRALQRRQTDAAACYEKALQLNPQLAAAEFNLKLLNGRRPAVRRRKRLVNRSS
jgi:tetratricopeptide (TPR) repeat protein